MWTFLVALALASDPGDAEMPREPRWDVPVRFEAGPLLLQPPVETRAFPGARPGARRARPLGIVLFSTALTAGFLVSIPAATGIAYATNVVE